MEREQFESTIRELVRPENNQHLRPWMTKLADPRQADVFIVGENQRQPYRTGAVSHERHVAALFNRPPEGCRRLYDELTSGSPSPTRKNIDALVGRLEDVGVENILETNVICYSTPMSNDLRHKANVGGARRGEKVFRFLLSSIDVRVLIVHGASTLRKLKSILRCDLPDPPNCPDDGRGPGSCLEARLAKTVESWRSAAPASLVATQNLNSPRFLSRTLWGVGMLSAWPSSCACCSRAWSTLITPNAS